MIRILTERVFEGNKKYIEAVGVHDDDKPTKDIVTGSVFVEVDTGDGFLFKEDATTPAWVKQ